MNTGIAFTDASSREAPDTKLTHYPHTWVGRANRKTKLSSPGTGEVSC